MLSKLRRPQSRRIRGKWATRRNPKYYNFDKLGGDCTNFISQCIRGLRIMNCKLTTVVIYKSGAAPFLVRRRFLYNFLVGKAEGPYARKTDISEPPGSVISQRNKRQVLSFAFVCRVGNPRL